MSPWYLYAGTRLEKTDKECQKRGGEGMAGGFDVNLKFAKIIFR